MFMCTFMLLELRHDHSIYGFLLFHLFFLAFLVLQKKLTRNFHFHTLIYESAIRAISLHLGRALPQGF